MINKNLTNREIEKIAYNYFRFSDEQDYNFWAWHILAGVLKDRANGLDVIVKRFDPKNSAPYLKVYDLKKKVKFILVL